MDGLGIGGQPWALDRALFSLLAGILFRHWHMARARAFSVQAVPHLSCLSMSVVFDRADIAYQAPKPSLSSLSSASTSSSILSA